MLQLTGQSSNHKIGCYWQICCNFSYARSRQRPSFLSALLRDNIFNSFSTSLLLFCRFHSRVFGEGSAGGRPGKPSWSRNIQLLSEGGPPKDNIFLDSYLWLSSRHDSAHTYLRWVHRESENNIEHNCVKSQILMEPFGSLIWT